LQGQAEIGIFTENRAERLRSFVALTAENTLGDSTCFGRGVNLCLNKIAVKE
jgi:hypothetical protein